MKIILAQPAIPRFLWELEILLTNMKQFTDMEVILLFTEHDFTVPSRLRDKYGCSVFVYPDTRDDTDYIPSVRPWLLWQYLAEDPAREQETYFYIDSDVIFREWPHFATLPISENSVVGSDCDGYIGYEYITQTQEGDNIAANMASICGITVEQMKGVPGIGAHLILTKPTAAFWQRAYEDSNKLYHYLEGVDSNIQKWTAEMWAQLWGWVREGKEIVMPKELDFCKPTDPIEEWDKVKIMHNAGVTADLSHELFFKGKYIHLLPWNEDFSFVRTDRVSHKYVEALKKVVL